MVVRRSRRCRRCRGHVDDGAVCPRRGVLCSVILVGFLFSLRVAVRA